MWQLQGRQNTEGTPWTPGKRKTWNLLDIFPAEEAEKEANSDLCCILIDCMNKKLFMGVVKLLTAEAHTRRERLHKPEWVLFWISLG